MLLLKLLLFNLFEEIGNRAVIEVPFALLDEQVEVLLRNTVISLEMPLCLVPEIGCFCI